jgi:hypothetical protein
MNAPPSLAIWIATAVHWGNTDGIAQCGMSRATPNSLDAAIGQPLAPYCPTGVGSHFKVRKDNISSLVAEYFVGRFMR